MDLSEPVTLPCGVVIPNRVALAAMTNKQSLADGLLGDDELHWLARRADGGFGMLTTCATYVALDGKAWSGELAIDRDTCVAGLGRLAVRLRRSGGAAFVQLFHGGVRASSALTGERVWSASEWRDDAPGAEAARAGGVADIERVIEQFAAAAARAQRAGFDGVELHGAHGYLLSQFLSRTQNTRTDAWGGDVARRAKLIREVVRAVRANVGPSFAIGVRLSLEGGGAARGLDLEDSLQTAAWLAQDGVDFIHASLWDARAMSKQRPDAHPLVLLRAAVPKRVPIVAAGAIWTRDDAAAAIDRGAELVALGRVAIVEPDWPKRVADPAWVPRRPPLTRAELAERAVSPEFAEYLTGWKNFVAG